MMDYKKPLSNYKTVGEFNNNVAENWYSRLNRLKKRWLELKDGKSSAKCERLITTMIIRMLKVSYIYNRLNDFQLKRNSFQPGGAIITSDEKIIKSKPAQQ